VVGEVCARRSAAGSLLGVYIASPMDVTKA